MLLKDAVKQQLLSHDNRKYQRLNANPHNLTMLSCLYNLDCPCYLLLSVKYSSAQSNIAAQKLITPKIKVHLVHISVEDHEVVCIRPTFECKPHTLSYKGLISIW